MYKLYINKQLVFSSDDGETSYGMIIKLRCSSWGDQLEHNVSYF